MEGSSQDSRRKGHLPANVNRILYVKNLSHRVTPEQLYDIFGKFGRIRQIRIGNTAKTKGTAFVVYEDIHDAKNAAENLTGFNMGNRYLIVAFHKHSLSQTRLETKLKEQAMEQARQNMPVSH